MYTALFIVSVIMLICDYVIHNDTIEGERVSGAEEIRRLILLEGEKY